MANICTGTMNVILPTKNKDKFLKLMEYKNCSDIDNENEYICAWADNVNETNNNTGFSFLSIEF